MNTYSVLGVDGISIGTVQATNPDTALINAISIYGAEANSVVRQYTANASAIDPIWILLAVLAFIVLSKKKN